MLGVNIQCIGERDEISGCQVAYIGLSQLYALDLADVNAGHLGKLDCVMPAMRRYHSSLVIARLWQSRP